MTSENILVYTGILIIGVLAFSKSVPEVLREVGSARQARKDSRNVLPPVFMQVVSHSYMITITDVLPSTPA